MNRTSSITFIGLTCIILTVLLVKIGGFISPLRYKTAVETSDSQNSSRSSGIVFRSARRLSQEKEEKVAFLLREDDSLYKTYEDLFKEEQFSELEIYYKDNFKRLHSPLANSKFNRLLGRAYLEQNRNEEALEAFGSGQLPINSEGLKNPHDLYAGIAYCRIGNLEEARKCYSDGLCLQFFSRADARDLPGTSNLKNMESSLLCAIAMDLKATADYQGALKPFVQASKLSPKNAFAAYGAAIVLLEFKRWQEAKPHLEVAVKYGRGYIFKDAKERLDGINYWIRQNKNINFSK
jgi:tetratricopeptide (TPR) repeat protein